VQAKAISPSRHNATAALHRWARASAQFTSTGVIALRMSRVPFSREVSKTRAVSAGDCESENSCWRFMADRWWRAEATLLRWITRAIPQCRRLTRVAKFENGDDLQTEES